MVNAARAWVAAIAGLALTGAFAASASAAPPGFQGEDRGHRGKDVRKGSKAPTPRQRELAARSGLTVRFNEHGTPGLVTARDGELQRGLPSGAEAAARAYLRDNRELFGLSAAALDDLELVSASPLGAGAAVLLRQRFGTLPAGVDGLVSVGVRDGQALFASSSLSRDSGAPAAPTRSAAQAVLAAAQDAGRTISPALIAERGRRGDWTVFEAPGFSDLVHVRQVAVPTPTDGVRAAFQVVLVDEQAADPLGYTSYVDARTGAVLVREDIVDSLADSLMFDVFPNAPRMDYSSTDTRELWCWAPGAPGCVRAVQNTASPFPWDVDARRARPTFRTEGNNARATEKWNSNDSGKPGTNYAESATRDFSYPWTNQWFEQACNPARSTSPAAKRHRRRRREPVRDAQPDARLVVPAGLHRGELQPAGGQLRARRLTTATPSSATRRRAASWAARRFASRDNANQITRPTVCRRHQHVPLAADRRQPSTRPVSTATTTCR